MAKKSDRAVERRISATEASRSFSRLLDRIALGERFLVRRRGRDVCLMSSPPVSGRRGSECIAMLRGRPPVLLDDAFARDLREVLSHESLEERPGWDS